MYTTPKPEFITEQVFNNDEIAHCISHGRYQVKSAWNCIKLPGKMIKSLVPKVYGVS